MYHLVTDDYIESCAQGYLGSGVLAGVLVQSRADIDALGTLCLCSKGN